MERCRWGCVSEKSINQKLSTIEQLQREITADQQQISECNFVLGQLANEEEE